MGIHEKKMCAVGKDRVKRGTSARDSGNNGNAEVWFAFFKRYHALGGTLKPSGYHFRAVYNSLPVCVSTRSSSARRVSIWLSAAAASAVLASNWAVTEIRASRAPSLSLWRVCTWGTQLSPRIRNQCHQPSSSTSLTILFPSTSKSNPASLTSKNFANLSSFCRFWYLSLVAKTNAFAGFPSLNYINPR